MRFAKVSTPPTSPQASSSSSSSSSSSYSSASSSASSSNPPLNTRKRAAGSSSSHAAAAPPDVRWSARAGLYPDRIGMRLRALHREGASAHVLSGGQGAALPAASMLVAAGAAADAGDDDLDFADSAVRSSGDAAAVRPSQLLVPDAKKSKKKAPTSLSTPTGRRRKRSFQEIDRSRRFVRPLCGVLEDLAAESSAALPDPSSPPVTFLTATVPASAYPPRRWCAMCGFESAYRCPACGSRTCSLRCSAAHPRVGGGVR